MPVRLGLLSTVRINDEILQGAAPSDAADRYRLQLENFAAAIEGKEPLLGRTDALGQARTIEALYRSAETGATGAPVSA